MTAPQIYQTATLWPRGRQVVAVPEGSPEDTDWQELARCAEADPEAYFPEKGGSTREAKKVCRRCEVREQCLEYALTHGEAFGIWGGMSERERRKIRRERGLEVAA